MGEIMVAVILMGYHNFDDLHSDENIEANWYYKGMFYFVQVGLIKA